MSKSFHQTDQKCDICGADGAFNVYDDLICAACFSDQCVTEDDNDAETLPDMTGCA